MVPQKRAFEAHNPAGNFISLSSAVFFGCDSCNAMVSSRLACMSQPFLHTKIIIPVLVQSGMFYSLTFFGNKGLIDFFFNRHPVRKFSLPSHHYYHPLHLRRPKNSPIPISSPPAQQSNAFFSRGDCFVCREADLGNAEGEKEGKSSNRQVKAAEEREQRGEQHTKQHARKGIAPTLVSLNNNNGAEGFANF